MSVLRAAAAGTSARATVERLHDVLLDVLKNADALGYRGRFERFAPAIADAFDLEFMAERSLGGQWLKLSDAVRTRWRELFRPIHDRELRGQLRSLVEPALRGHCGGGRDERHDARPHQSQELDHEDVDLTYRLRRAGDGWKIVDVYLKGTVSELALRRADFTSVLDREGYATLESTVRARLEDLAAGRGKRPFR
jgi:phospholipid transport system substrate-binding protein